MNKRLGRGIDLFLEKQSDEEIFRKALKFEGEKNWLFAFHLYMSLIEKDSHLKVKALNNAAAILAEHGFEAKAIEFLEEAANLDPSNKVINENLNKLKEER